MVNNPVVWNHIVLAQGAVTTADDASGLGGVCTFGLSHLAVHLMVQCNWSPLKSAGDTIQFINTSSTSSGNIYSQMQCLEMFYYCHINRGKNADIKRLCALIIYLAIKKVKNNPRWKLGRVVKESTGSFSLNNADPTQAFSAEHVVWSQQKWIHVFSLKQIFKSCSSWEETSCACLASSE